MVSQLHGKKGLNQIMTYKTQESPFPLCYDFEYKPSVLEKYGRVFQSPNINKYSAKISKISNIIGWSPNLTLTNIVEDVYEYLR